MSRGVNVQSDLNMTEEVMVTHALRESGNDNSPEISDISTNELLVFVTKFVLKLNSIFAMYLLAHQSI